PEGRSLITAPSGIGCPTTLRDNPLRLTPSVPPRRRAARRRPIFVDCTVAVVMARFPSTLYVFSPVMAVCVTSLTMNRTDAAGPAPLTDALTVTGPGVGPNVSVICASPLTVGVEVADGRAPPVTSQITVAEGVDGVTLTTSGFGRVLLMTPS